LTRAAIAPGAIDRRATAAVVARRAFIGDGAVKYRHLLAPHAVIEPTPLLAATVSRLAHERIGQGEAPPPHAIRPLYVRRPDAELARGRGPSP
jgi:tRNA A37 threonylcarbamoyladenosine modification protein TsaB